MSKSINTLTRQLRDLNPETRSKAAMNLGEMGAEEAVPSMISAFKKDKDENVRSVFAETFALFSSNDDVVAALIYAKDNDKSEIVRVSANWALDQIVNTRGHASLQALLEEIEK
ncbi:MAG: HEAT repeat domain-containing protein [Candidatus Heimdallarchaeota archaeon]|nr:HEAT repeat domain-containing protein [Candidatus Heimdallarchaeota archaeon]MCK5184540.1 HEAT repeat domain-containing protein [Candidatus Heimdallarchaeota archaeon]MCK5298087.1 HEAT repeat domain-containing protein [Candidatus Heimdallarchaeota archaeon]